MSSSTSTSTLSANNLSSRFSTLKAFKFGNAKPPPPPPKDEYYLQNRSMASLSPDAYSLPPNSPLSPAQHPLYTSQASNDPNHSTMSLTSSIASGLSSPPQDAKRPRSRGKEKALSFLKFGRKSPKSPAAHDGFDDTPPQEDANISMPFNFQHNIHVNDELSGLPPTWSTALSQAGLSPEEIANYHAAKRAADARSPTQYYLNTRPASPTIRHPYQTATPSVPMLTQPGPRMSSLPRQYSDASLRSNANSQRPAGAVPIPFNPSASVSSLHSSQAGSVGNARAARPYGSQDTTNRIHTPQLSVSYSSDSHYSGVVGGDDGYQASKIAVLSAEASSPPRTRAHVPNPSIASSLRSQGPSPLNGHNRNDSALSTASSRLHGAQPGPLPGPSSYSSHNRTFTSLTTDSALSDAQSTTTAGPNRNTKRTGALPPRLSLHQATGSNDLSSWAGAFLSGISSELDEKSTLGSIPMTPQSAPASAATQQLPTARPPQGRQRADTETRPNLTTAATSQSITKPPIRQASEPLPELDERQDGEAQYANLSPPWTGDIPSSNSPLWKEIEGILGQAPSPSSTEGTHQRGPYSAALADTFSPTLPFTPEEDRLAMERKLRTERSRERFDQEQEDLDLNRLSVNTARPNRDSSRSSTSTISAIAATTIVRHVSVARRAGAYVVSKSNPVTPVDQPAPTPPTPALSPPVRQLPHRPPAINAGLQPSSPHSSLFESEEDSSGSSSQSQDPYPTPSTGGYSISDHIQSYLEPSPSPSQSVFSPIQPPNKDYPAVPPAPGDWDDDDYDEDYDEDYDDEGTSLVVPNQIVTAPSPNRPTIVINADALSPGGGLSTALPSGAPASPFQRYRGWLSEVVAPLEEFIDDGVDPRDHYLDLTEIAEGESGSVFSARLIEKDANRLALPAHVKARDEGDFANKRTVLVAIKSVQITPSGSPKLNDLQHELTLMKGLWHENVIGLDSLYVDFLEDTLWIRMELMERSLADIIELVDAGLILQDRIMARFAGDILSGLEYLQRHHIAHRDVRSDNLLVNKHGVLKLTDFANAVKVTPENPMRTDPAGVLYWQAPEVRSPPYNALKVDVWSLGATVWEMAETQPPFADTNVFADRWPSVSQPNLYSSAFHDFLRLCSEPAASRPTAGELLKTPFIRNACGRQVIVQLLSQCIALQTLPDE